MPIDPTISLNAQGVQPQGFLSGNPVSTIAGFAQVQNALNQNRLFQQTFAARQQAGSILAAAPDLETGLQQLYQNPLTAPFAGEVANSIRAGQQTLTQIQGEQQHQAQSGMEAVFKALPGLYSNPTNQQWQSSMNAALAPLSPVARQRAMDGIESIRMGLMDNLPADPQAAQATMRQRIGAFMLGGGVTPEVIRAATGTLAPQVATMTGPAGQSITAVVGGPAVPGAAMGTGAGASPNSANSPLAGSAPGVLSTGPTATQAKYLTDRGTDMAQYQQHLDANVQTGGLIQQTLQQARDAMSQFKPGGGAEVYEKLGAIAQAFGAAPALVDKISNGNLAASQEFQKLMTNTTMGQIREQLSGLGGSRLSQMEFATFNKNNPNIDTDPRAIEKIFNFWTSLYQRDRAEQAGLNNYLGNGGDISKWPATWQATAQHLGYINPTVDASGKPTEKVTSPALTQSAQPAPANALTGRPPLSQFNRP